MGTPIAMIALPLFGILTMAFLLNVRLKEISNQKKAIAMLFVTMMVVLNVWVDYVLGRPAYRAAYFLLVQFPLFILFRMLTHYRGIKLLFVTLTTITMAALPVNINLTVSTLIVKSPPVTNIVLLLSCLLLLAIIYFFLKPDFNYVLQYGESKEFWKFCIIPVVYYVYGFSITGYNFTQDFAVHGFFVRRIPDIIVFISYILAVNIFRNTREKQLMKNEQAMLTLQLSAAEQKMSELYTTNMQAKAYRHDLRHHLSLLGSFAIDGDIDKIKDYLVEAQGKLDDITPICFCENETVSLILSTFDRKAKAKNIELWVDAKLPKKLPIPDTELCEVFYNGLENALTATAQMEDTTPRTVQVECFIKGDKLMLMIQNPYAGNVKVENDIPISLLEGHGFGCRSIAAIAEKRKGCYTFVAEKGVFILRVILPISPVKEMQPS